MHSRFLAALGAALLSLACSESTLPTQGGLDGGDGGRDAAQSAVDGAPRRDHDIVMARCGRPAFGSDWLLVPTATTNGGGTECSRREDCTEEPHGLCVGSAEGQCRYPTNPATGSCELDADCFAEDGGTCSEHKEIRRTQCQYDACAVDGDCPTGSACMCADDRQGPACVKGGCTTEDDCPNGQTCLEDQVNWPSLRHCTTPRDQCAKDEDCGPDFWRVCGFNEQLGAWTCMQRVIAE
ncbi:MAG: hypothetical protein QM778_22255 [Myxococcales bacterium]